MRSKTSNIKNNRREVLTIHRAWWKQKLLKLFWPTRYLFTRAARLPGLEYLTRRLLFNELYMKVLPSKRTVEKKERVILPGVVVDHFIENASYIFAMDACICRQANNCDNYPLEIGCLFIGEGARKINPGFGREISAREAKALQKRAENTGLINIVGKNRLDKLYLGVNPSEQMLTVCHCCECCCLWQLLTVLPGSIADRVKKMDGVEVAVTGNCKGCGNCAQVCFVNAIFIENDAASIDPDICRGCGRCVLKCPEQAINLTFEENAYFKKCLELIALQNNVNE